jgi:nitroreductase
MLKRRHKTKEDLMDFQELAAKRYSVRSYKADPVEDEKLEAVLEAAVLAPTAANRQPFRVYVIHTKGRQEELKRIYNRDWFVQPPLVLCVCGVPGEAWVRKYDDANYYQVDATIVMDHIIMAAADLGLGTCWIAAFKPEEAREVLELPEDEAPVVFTPLGYPADELGPKRRREKSELIKEMK